MSDVTRSATEFTKLKNAEQSVTSSRNLARERKRRQRALSKQATAIEFVRTDASLFLHPDRLSQKAGAPKAKLRAMAIKELVDNALDAAPIVTLTEIDDDTFEVQDNGPGLSPTKVAALFSVTRPMMSTKLIRRPTRGMIGNGLRVATGAAFASGGKLIVESCGTRQELGFNPETGDTNVTAKGASAVKQGTLIRIKFGPALPRDVNATAWGKLAIRLAGMSAKPMLTHPNWYSEAAFDELVQAARGSAHDVAALFGVDLEKDIGSIDPDGSAAALSLDILTDLAPKEPKLIPLPDDAFPGAYRIERGEGHLSGAVVPVIVQAWAQHAGNSLSSGPVKLIVNRTQAIAELSVWPGGAIEGCGLCHTFPKPPKGTYHLTIAITAPAVEIVNDGKTPNLEPFVQLLAKAIGQTMRKAHKPKPSGQTTSFKDAAFDIMEDAYLKASAGGSLPANARQIMYAARPYILMATRKAKLDDAYFTQNLLPSFIEANPELTADWDVVYDARGHFVEPHTGASLPLGTIHVREYLKRQPRHVGKLLSTFAGLHSTVGPNDRYGAVLFIEKEGFEPLLRAAKIAERFDIAVMSTKGMSVIAARALVDRLSTDGLKILVAHDLDLAGIRIFGTLGSDSSRYQFAARPDIHRLGLTLDQANDMDLQVERQDIKGDSARILAGVMDYGATDDEVTFIGSGQRVELNAMPADVFLQWIEAGLIAHSVEKVIPSASLIEQRARQVIALDHLRKDVGDLEAAAKEYAAKAELPADLVERIRAVFASNPTLAWEDAIERVVSP